VLRQARFLAEEHEVTVAAFGISPEIAESEFVELSPRAPRTLARSLAGAARRLAGRYHAAYWRDSDVRRWSTEIRRALPVDAIVVNDLFTVPLARALAPDVPVIFDSHEHWSSESASWTRLQKLSMRRAHDWIVDEHVPKVAGMMAVSRGIRDDYERRTGLRPALVTNAPWFHELQPSSVSDPIRVLHVGTADPRRRLEDTIEAVRAAGDRFTLDLILIWENDYRRQLERLAGSDERIRVLPPVSNRDLITIANDYDVGAFLLPARYPNQVHVLPNKLFEYIQARLAVAIGPSPEMAAVVAEWDCGVVSPSFAPDSFAEALAALGPGDVERMKRNADRAARALNAEANREKVLRLVRDAIALAPSPSSAAARASR
jgi:glycosyltransferase involved in cell wall biosynthesis